MCSLQSASPHLVTSNCACVLTCLARHKQKAPHATHNGQPAGLQDQGQISRVARLSTHGVVIAGDRRIVKPLQGALGLCVSASLRLSKGRPGLVTTPAPLQTQRTGCLPGGDVKPLQLSSLRRRRPILQQETKGRKNQPRYVQACRDANVAAWSIIVVVDSMETMDDVDAATASGRNLPKIEIELPGTGWQARRGKKCLWWKESSTYLTSLTLAPALPFVLWPSRASHLIHHRPNPLPAPLPCLARPGSQLQGSSFRRTGTSGEQPGKPEPRVLEPWSP